MSSKIRRTYDQSNVICIVRTCTLTEIGKHCKVLQQAYLYAGRFAQEGSNGIYVLCEVIKQMLLERSREIGWPHADRERAIVNALLDGILSFEERR